MEEHFVLNEFSFLKLTSLLIKAVFCCAVFALLRRKFHKQSNSNTSVVGKSKFNFSQFYGFLRTALSYSGRKKIWYLLHSDVISIFNSYVMLHPDEKIIRVTFGPAQLVVLIKSDPIEELLKSKEVQMSIPEKETFAVWFGKSFTLSTGSEWKSKKKFVTPMFHKLTIQAYVPKFDEHSKALVDVLKSRQNEEWIDISKITQLFTMECGFEMALGTSLSAQVLNSSEYIQMIRRTTQALTSRVMNPFLHYDFIFRRTSLGRQLEKDISYLRGFIKQNILRKKVIEGTEHGEEDDLSSNDREPHRKNLLSHLLNVNRKNPEFTEDDVIDEIAAFLYGNFDTTSMAMAWVLYIIGHHPDIQNKIHKELDSIFGNDKDRAVTFDDVTKMQYLDCVMKESQRIFPSIPFNSKQLHQDTKLCGQKIGKGTIIMISHYHLHRNPEVFHNPEQFDPNRFLPENCRTRGPYSYIPFSAGERPCMGRKLAMLEEKIFLANVLRNFTVKSLDHRDKIRIRANLVLYSPDPLKLKFTPRILL